MSEATEIVEPVLDAASEAILEGVDGVADVMTVAKNNPVVVVAAGIGGLLVGAGIGYFIAAKRLGAQFDQRLESELEAAKEFYRGVNKVDEDGVVLSPREALVARHGEDAAEAALAEMGGRALSSYRGDVLVEETLDEEEQALLAKSVAKVEVRETETPEEVEVKVSEETTFNIFEDDGFDLEHEKKNRTSQLPYVISHDEYFANDPEHDQVEYSYFVEDDVVVDERNDIVRDLDNIGEQNLRFGHGSKDRNIVYIRNERLELDYVITKFPGSYVVDVLGLADEDDDHNSLRHSSDVRRKRDFRHGRD